MDWEATRGAYPILSRRTYLNTCSLGALSSAVRQAVGGFLDLWEERGASAWYQTWLAEVARARERFARLIHASPDEVAILPNVSTALGVLASAGPQDGNVVCGALDFPTIPYQWRVKPGVEVRLARSPDGVRMRAEDYEPLVDAGTRWVATSHVAFGTGALLDAKRVVDVARARGALTLLDGYQAAGQVPVDVRELGVDAYVSGGLKWLLGGPGVCYLYVRKDLHARLAPTTTGWFAHADAFAFDAACFRAHGDARRFETGTPAMAAVYAGAAGLDQVLALGPARIRGRTAALVDDLAERLADAGFALLTPDRADERAGIVAVRVEDAPRAVARLARDGIIVDARPGRVRISPYFYNTERENERVVDALRTALA